MNIVKLIEDYLSATQSDAIGQHIEVDEIKPMLSEDFDGKPCEQAYIAIMSDGNATTVTLSDLLVFMAAKPVKELTQIERITDDMKRRGSKVLGFMVEDKNGQAQFLQYDEDGNNTFFSDAVDCMSISERTGRNTVRPMFNLGNRHNENN